MKNKSIILSAILATAVLASCGKEELKNKQTDAALDYRSAPSSISVKSWWSAGSTSINTASVQAANTYDVIVENNHQSLTGVVAFRRYNLTTIGNNMGRSSNTSVDKGTATHAFADSLKGWKSKVPFAFGTHTASGNNAIWTPAYGMSTPRPIHMAQFIKDNETGDLDNTVGRVQVGNFRMFEIEPSANHFRVVIQELRSGTWVEVVRSKGSQQRCRPVSLAVLKVRTDFTVTGGRIASQTFTDVPVALAQNSTIPFGLGNANNQMELYSLPFNGSVDGAYKMTVLK